jgi:hypothetical protein
MKNGLMIFAAVACAFGAQDLVLSKDSLWVLNNFPPSRNGDSVIIINSGAEAVWLDSGRLFFDVLDTGRSFFNITGAQMVMDAWHNGVNERAFFGIKQDTGQGFYLDFSFSSKPLLPIGPLNDSIIIGNTEIVDCFFCDEPRFPNYLRGRVRFFFSNGQSVDIILHSDDRRPDSGPCGDFACDSLNVRKILDRNGMGSVAVSEVSSVANGRIISLQLSYGGKSADVLPKQCTVLPPEIGNLTALKSLSMTGNSFDTIPLQIGRCINLEYMIASDNNIIFLSDSIVRCSRLRTFSIENNRLTRLPDSIGNLKSIRSLVLSNNLLTSLPGSIVNIDSMQCIFISGNKICTLPEAIVAWLGTVQTNRNCTRPEPVWPDSQHCDFIFAKRASSGKNHTAFTMKRIARKGDFLIVELDDAAGAMTGIEIFDCSGKMVEKINLPTSSRASRTIRLDGYRYPAGWYFVRVRSGASSCCGRAVLIPIR